MNYMVGREAFADNDIEKAKLYLKRSLEIYPELYFSHYLLGYIAITESKHALAIEHLRAAVEYAPFHDFSRFFLAEMYYLTKQFDLSKRHYRILAEKGYENVNVYTNLGWIYFAQDQADSASYYWQKGLQLQPDSRRILEGMSQLRTLAAPDSAQEK